MTRVAQLLGVGTRGDGPQVGASGRGRRRAPGRGPRARSRPRCKRLKRENAELRRANAILKAAAAFFGPSSTGPPGDRGLHPRARRPPRGPGGLRWGVEPICAVLTEHGLPIAPSTYYEHVEQGRRPRASSAMRCLLERDPPGPRRQLRRVRGAEGVAPAEPRGHPGGPLHGGAADARATGWPARSAARSSAPRSPTRPPSGPGTWSAATSPRPPRTGSGSPTSPTSRRGRGGCTSRSSSTPTPAGSWAGGAGRRMSTQLVLDALEQAVWTRQRDGRSLDSVVAHTDRGSQGGFNLSSQHRSDCVVRVAR